MYRLVAAHHAPPAYVVAAPPSPSAPWTGPSSTDTVKDRPPSSERRIAGSPAIMSSATAPTASRTRPSVASDVSQNPRGDPSIGRSDHVAAASVERHALIVPFNWVIATSPPSIATTSTIDPAPVTGLVRSVHVTPSGDLQMLGANGPWAGS